MKLIFAVDAIYAPLTGIGRYALELASRLPACNVLEEIRFLTHFRWIKDLNLLVPGENGTQQDAQSRTLLNVIRQKGARSNLMVEAFRTVSPFWRRRMLNGCDDFLYHSPNFFLPARGGVSIATVHDLSVLHFPEMHPLARVKYFEKEFRKTLERCQFLITDSEAVKEEIIDMFGWPKHLISAIPLGSSPDFRPRAPSELEPTLNDFSLRPNSYSLCVATLEPRKNLGALIEAYAELPEEIRNRFPLVVVGAVGWLEETIKIQLERGIGQGWLIYLGFVPQNKLPILYSGARCFCYLSKYEGFGLPVLEAMASGLPIVMSNAASLVELAGTCALVVDPEDIDGVRVALTRALDDELWRCEAQDSGRARAADYSWESCVDATLSVYSRASKQPL